MKKQHGCALLLLIASQATFIANAQSINDNPFEFKKSAPVVVEEVEQVVVDPNPELSDLQSKMVKEMIRSAIDAIEIKAISDEDDFVEMDGKKYIVMRDGDREVGVSSGMRVIYSAIKMDYKYYDVQKYKQTITLDEYKDAQQRSIEAAKNALESADSVEDDIKKKITSPKLSLK